MYKWTETIKCIIITLTNNDGKKFTVRNLDVKSIEEHDKGTILHLKKDQFFCKESFQEVFKVLYGDP
jgi:uncharacterized protein YlzI (FlbEa/FlbD family)